MLSSVCGSRCVSWTALAWKGLCDSPSSLPALCVCRHHSVGIQRCPFNTCGLWRFLWYNSSTEKWRVTRPMRPCLSPTYLIVSSSIGEPDRVCMSEPTWLRCLTCDCPLLCVGLAVLEEHYLTTKPGDSDTLNDFLADFCSVWVLTV